MTGTHACATDSDMRCADVMSARWQRQEYRCCSMANGSVNFLRGGEIEVHIGDEDGIRILQFV